jgi:hypothetical protein
VSRFAPQTASAASSVNPPEKIAERSLVLGQELVAPRDRRPERSLALGGVAGASREQRQPLLKPLEELAGREESDPGRRELDRERQPIEPGADRGHRLPLGLVDRWARIRHTGTLDEQPDRVLFTQGSDGVLALGSHVQRLAAGGDQVQRGCGRRKLGHLRGGLGQ